MLSPVETSHQFRLKVNNLLHASGPGQLLTLANGSQLNVKI